MQACAAVLHDPVRCLDRACACPPQAGQVPQSLPCAVAALQPFAVCPCIRVPSDACHRQRPTETQDKSRRSFAQRQPEYFAPSPRSFFSRLMPHTCSCNVMRCNLQMLKPMWPRNWPSQGPGPVQGRAHFRGNMLKPASTSSFPITRAARALFICGESCASIAVQLAEVGGAGWRLIKSRRGRIHTLDTICIAPEFAVWSNTKVCLDLCVGPDSEFWK